MSKEYVRREAIFNKYSRNLDWIQEHPSFKFEPNIKDSYICPLCFRIFERSDLKSNSPTPLTFDHNPPEALGGKSGVLTCKDCNSTSGTQLDSQLIKILMEGDFGERLPHSKMRTTVESEGNKIAADVMVDSKGKIKIDLLKEYSNPKHFDKIMEGGSLIYISQEPVLKKGQLSTNFKEIPVTIKNPMNANLRRVEVTLLKIAYLQAFELFGYGMLIHPFMHILREQIKNADKIILPNILSNTTTLSREMLGVNFLRNPKELKCFLMVFEVHTKSKSRIFSVPLPGWSEPGLDIYFPDKHKQFSNLEGVTINCDFTQFYGIDYVSEKESAFAAMDIWFNFENSTNLL